MSALVLFRRDDAAQAAAASALTLVDLGVDPRARGSDRAPRLLGFAATAAATAEAPDPDTWTPKQLSFSGLARAEVAREVLAQAYDLIVNLCPGAFPPFDFLCAGATAHLRAARHDGALHAYDLVIGAGDLGGFTRELRAYLRALNPHPHG